MARRQLSDRDQRSATVGSARARITEQGLIAGALSLAAFLCYYATLLPGLDLGDSASFQTGAGSLTLTPRQAYPLYYALGNVFVWLHPGEPARAMNLASAVYGSLAVGVAVIVGARLTGSALAGAAGGLFLGCSYTFWTQAITAEVYTLHLLISGAAVLALLHWAERPTATRLAIFYAIYALGFGNHLSMVLLLPAFAVFLLARAPAPAVHPLRPRLILLAAAIATLGALQYAWNFRGLWAGLEPPASLAEAFGQFWFDVTKEDWRETLVMSVSETGLRSRPAMYWFDLRQQFGAPGVALAGLGLGFVTWRSPSRGVLLLLLYGANLAFAWTYNVGDAYIFFLPSHFVVALAAGAGVAAVAWMCGHAVGRRVAAAMAAPLLLYPAWRGYDLFPAVDRSWDRRAERLLDTFTADPQAIYGVDANWQVQNAVEYFMRERKPAVPWFTTGELEWLDAGDPARVNRFVADNASAGRRVIVTDRALHTLREQGGLKRQAELPSHLMAFATTVRAIPPGTPYVLAILRNDREYPLNAAGLVHAWNWLAPGHPSPELRHYTVVAGRIGDAPLLVRADDRPFRTRVRVEPYLVDIRMESWLPTDTIRRAGFGQVVVDRRHRLTLERGVSFAALGPGGEPAYASGLFAPLPRLALPPPR